MIPQTSIDTIARLKREEEQATLGTFPRTGNWPAPLFYSPLKLACAL